MIRAILDRDLDNLKEIHRKHYAKEFDFPDFNKHFINSFSITDDNNSIILAGGIRPILEVVAITDKDRDIKDRVRALSELLQISAFIANHDGFDEIHAFVQDGNWEKILKKKGFADTRGKSLVFKV